MENAKSDGFKKVLSTAYKIYHFVAKVVLYSILVILLLVAAGFIAYVVDLTKNIKAGETKPPLLGAYIIISPSMEPTIKVEDAIVIVREEPENLKVGDIITFTSNDPRYSGLIITHRIVGIQKSDTGSFLFRTKGDNNNSEDAALVPSDNIYGRVILKIPKIGYIQYVLTQAYGWLIIVVIPCLGIVIYDIIKLIKSIKNGLSSSSKKKMKKNKNDNVEIIDSEQNNNIEEIEEEVDNSTSSIVEQENIQEAETNNDNDNSDNDIEVI